MAQTTLVLAPCSDLVHIMDIQADEGRTLCGIVRGSGRWQQAYRSDDRDHCVACQRARNRQQRLQNQLMSEAAYQRMIALKPEVEA